MNPNRTYEENMAALKKVLTQRTYTALSHRNIEFVLKYQNATTQELAAYLRRQQAELRHIPGRTEIIGGDFIELRFRGWVLWVVSFRPSNRLKIRMSCCCATKKPSSSACRKTASCGIAMAYRMTSSMARSSSPKAAARAFAL